MGLQKALPQARVVYCSATGASEPRNLGYMDRLGLWGPGTPSFSNFQVPTFTGRGGGGGGGGAGGGARGGGAPAGGPAPPPCGR